VVAIEEAALDDATQRETRRDGTGAGETHVRESHDLGSLVGKLTHIHDCHGTEATAAARAAAAMTEGPRQANDIATDGCRFQSPARFWRNAVERSLELPHTNKLTHRYSAGSHLRGVPHGRPLV